MPKAAFATHTKRTRSKETKRAYLKGGCVLLKRAQAKMARPVDVIDAFRGLFGDPNLTYRPATTRLYQQQIKAVIGRKLHDGELSHERAISGFAEIKALLIARRGACPKRTSSGKLKNPAYEEFRKILADFARRSRLPGGLDRTDTVLAIMVKTGAYVGLRPCEWLNAKIVGKTLEISNAKRGNGRAMSEVRSIRLASLPPNIVTSVSHLIDELRLLFAEADRNWRRILGRLGERLARVCARIGIRRWSLYTTRHVAIANWKRAGLSKAEIAALAGHSSTRTARQHYAGGRHGWKADFACARPDPDLVAATAAHNSVTPCASANTETTSVAPVSAVAAHKKTWASAVQVNIAHPLMVFEMQHERLAVPTIKDQVSPTPPGDDATWEANEAPAFGMS
jgi:integrase